MRHEPGFVLAGALLTAFVLTAGAAAGASGAGSTWWATAARIAAPRITAPAADAAPAAPAAVDGARPTGPVATPTARSSLARAAATWVSATSAATGVPTRALQAYGDATLSSHGSDAGCRLGWTTLAAIGHVESGHGRGNLQDDGRPTVPVVGPALDGSAGVAAIRATAASTAWHGDAVWDHAVGPMQFLPSTWLRWGADGDGDGTADPNDLDDAALAAAHYLCAAGGDLASAAGWSAAVRAYNHDDAYVAAVLATADGYARAAGG